MLKRLKPSILRSMAVCGIIGLLCLLLAACSSAPAPTVQEESAATDAAASPTTEAMAIDDGFDRQALLANLTNNVIIPQLKNFVEQSAALEDAAHTFRDDPTEANLEAVQQAWQATALAWKMCEFYELGSFRNQDDTLVSFMVVYNQIDKWPTNTDFIETLIDEQEMIDEPLVDSNGSTTKGLPAIEYIIFNPEGDNNSVLNTFVDAPNAEKRMQYLVAATENLHNKAELLLTIWAADGDNFAAMFINGNVNGGDPQASISLLVNQMAAGLEDIVKRKIGHPLGKTSEAGVRPELVEAELSEISGQMLDKNLEGFAATFNGSGDVEPQLGFDDYLDYLDAEYEGQPLSTVINDQIETTRAALAAIDEPLHLAMENETEQVEQVYNEARKLIVLIKADMANHLAVTMTFNDSDGD
ncbi:MAG: imelysin family protein [Anaerolineae bacterium]|nr:imelysin family protein [Anaerolineae bacterium]